MHIRVFRLNVRNPLVGAALVIATVGLVLAFLIFGFTLLIGAMTVGTVALLARRILRPLRRQPQTLEPLDSAQEIFPPGKAGDRLPPGSAE